MAIDRKTITELRELIDDFDTLCIEALSEFDTQYRYNPETHKYETQKVDYLMAGSKTTGALRRRSMDLTRKLAELRAPR